MKQKRLNHAFSLRWLVAAVLTLIPLSIFAEDFTYEGITYTILSEDEKTCETKRGTAFNAGNRVEGEVVLPSNPNGYKLTKISDWGFMECNSLTSIVIPETVTSIGFQSFSGCNSLFSVTIPGSVSSIGKNAFYNCNSLERAEFSSIESLCIIKFGDSLSNPLSYAPHLYIDGYDISAVDIPESVTSIGDYAFNSYASLKSINIPNSVTRIGKYAFQNCKLLESVNLSEGLESIEEGAFESCEALRDIFIPKTVKSIYSRAFRNCFSLQNLELPLHVNSLSSITFEGCNLNPLCIRGNLTYVSPSSFQGMMGTIECRQVNIEEIKKYFKGTIVPIEELYKIESFKEYLKGVGFSLVKNLNSDYKPEDFKVEIFSEQGALLKTIDEIKSEYVIDGLDCKTNYTLKVSWTEEDGYEVCIEKSFTTVKPEYVLKYDVKQTNITFTEIGIGNEDITYKVETVWIRFNETTKKFENSPLAFYGLYPEEDCLAYIHVFPKLEQEALQKWIKTKGWDCNLSVSTISPTVANVVANFTEDTAHPNKVWWEIGDQTLDGKAGMLVSLTPNKEQTATFKISYGRENQIYSYPLKIKTGALELKTLQPKCVSASCAIVAAETNISDDEPNAGFEWKKYDAPASLAPSQANAIVCDGMLEGYLKNLQSTSYYNVRAFYKDTFGNYYYGEWITFDPSDFSYFEPTVRTYPVQNVTSSMATVRGYVLPGTDAIKRQGFQYWKNGGSKTRGNTPAESEISTVVATGQLMTATLDNLEPGTDYTFRVFVETEAGLTYGGEQSFTTEGSSAISEIGYEDVVPTVVGYYNMMGVKSDRPYKGINIVVYSDGSSKKIIK